MFGIVLGVCILAESDAFQGCHVVPPTDGLQLPAKTCVSCCPPTFSAQYTHTAAPTYTHTHIGLANVSFGTYNTLWNFSIFFFFCFFLLFLELREWIFLFANVRGKLVLGVGGWAKSFNTLFPVVVDFAYKLTYKLIFRSAKVLSFFELSMWANRWNSCKII